LDEEIIVAEVQDSIFSIRHWFSSVNFRTQDITIRIGFGMQITKTSIYSVICDFHFLLHCDHNTPTLQTDGRTDVMLVAYGMYMYMMSR